jgi:toxin CcdB
VPAPGCWFSSIILQVIDFQLDTEDGQSLNFQHLLPGQPLLSQLGTRVVIPLFEKQSLGIKPLTKLTPEFAVDGKKCILMTPQLAGIPIKELGEPVGDLARHRSDIIAALDLLITGF